MSIKWQNGDDNTVFLLGTSDLKEKNSEAQSLNDFFRVKDNKQREPRFNVLF